MATIQIGGLATGLDTTSLINQLVGVEQQPIKLLQQQQAAVQATRASIDVITSKLSTFRSAAAALQDAGDVLVRKASSSDEGVVSAVAGTGASAGTVSLNVSQLARASIAGATVGVASGDAKVATGAGHLRFQVGTGAVVDVSLDDTTTLNQLVGAINDKQAGVTASAVNLGTDSNPNYRLQIVTKATGQSQTISVLQDDTTLGIQTAQSGLNARFTVSGFTGTFERETNGFSDVLPGVSFSLRNTGTAQITVEDDTAAITKNAKALADSFNDLVSFVSSQSVVSQDGGQGTDASVGPLAGDTTVRRLIDQLHDELTRPVSGLTNYINLSGIGFATQKDGTVAFDATKFQEALADDPTAVARVFSGANGIKGAAARVVDLADQLSAPDGALASDAKHLDDQSKSLQNDIDTGNAQIATIKQQLTAQFTALETLVSGLQQQSSFLTSAFGGSSGK